MYFDSVPNILYPDFKDKSNFKLAKNIFRRIRGRDNFNAIYLAANDYTIQDGETPDKIAQKMLGSDRWYWTILILNNIIDYTKNWPLSNDELENMIEIKYGQEANTIRHWETLEIRDSGGKLILPSGIVIEINQKTEAQQNPNYVPQILNMNTREFENWNYKYRDSVSNIETVAPYTKLIAVTNKDYEYELNERKRIIKIPRQEYLGLLERELRELMKYETSYKITKEGYRISEP